MACRNSRFQVEEEYEWCGAYEAFRHLLLPQLRRTDRVGRGLVRERASE